MRKKYVGLSDLDDYLESRGFVIGYDTLGIDGYESVLIHATDSLHIEDIRKHGIMPRVLNPNETSMWDEEEMNLDAYHDRYIDYINYCRENCVYLWDNLTSGIDQAIMTVNLNYERYKQYTNPVLVFVDVSCCNTEYDPEFDPRCIRKDRRDFVEEDVSITDIITGEEIIGKSVVSFDAIEPSDIIGTCSISDGVSRYVDSIVERIGDNSDDGVHTVGHILSWRSIDYAKSTDDEIKLFDKREAARNKLYKMLFNDITAWNCEFDR